MNSCFFIIRPQFGGRAHWRSSFDSWARTLTKLSATNEFSSFALLRRITSTYGTGTLHKGLTLCGLLIRAAYQYYWYHWDRYLSTDTHVFQGLHKIFCKKNTAKTLWLAIIIISSLNIILSTLNPMVIFICSLHFSNILGVMPFAKKIIFTKNSTNVTPHQHFLSLYFQWYLIDIYLVSINCRYDTYHINKAHQYAALSAIV